MGPQRERKILERTLKIYTGVIVVVFFVLLLRLAWLQLVQAEDFRTIAVSNTMRWIRETATRGEIWDKDGEVIATSRPVFNVALDYLGLKDQDVDKVIKDLLIILNDPEITFESVKQSIKSGDVKLFEPIIIKRDIPIELVTVIEEQKRDLPGVNITAQPQRHYNYENLAGHLLGYVHSIKEELELPEYEDYSIGDLVGKTGLEKQYEQYLRGEDGFRQMEVTARNQPIREVLSIPPVPGDTVITTIDLDLQQIMEQAFDQTLLKVQEDHPKALAGGAVLLDVNTGKVLAMTSRPSLYPDDFNGHSMNQTQADYYFRNTPPALYNRVIQGSYVPGSTFKPIIGMAALEAGVMDPDNRIQCSGSYWHPPYIKCWNVHGSVSYYSAMAGSCNVYFQEMASRAGIEYISRVGYEFGLGRPSGIDLPFESSGLLPDLQWQAMEFGARAAEINKKINDKITELEIDYQEKISQAANEREIRTLQNQLRAEKRVQEQERSIQLEHYTKWHDWDTYNIGIGQGYNQYTIIQIANFTSTLANGGKLYSPYTVEKIIDNLGNTVEEFMPKLLARVNVSEMAIAETQKAMRAVTEPGGTAYSLFKHFPAEIKVAAKTGTAQPGRAGYIKNKDFDGLFIAYAPADDPQIAFAGVIEHGWSGSGSIGLVAKAVFEEYFGVSPVALEMSVGDGDVPVQNNE